MALCTACTAVSYIFNDFYAVSGRYHEGQLGYLPSFKSTRDDKLRKGTDYDGPLKPHGRVELPDDVRIVRIAAAGNSSWALDSEGRVWEWGKCAYLLYSS